MSADHRVVLNGRALPYSCGNYRFQTKVAGPSAGKPHGIAGTLGSVTGGALIGATGYSLWLEHVEEKGNPAAEWYWLMWYDDASGMPTIPGSSVFTKDQLADMVRKLVEEFMP